MVSIAEQYGFFWETLWNHPNNKDLRGLRHDPTVLLLDDEVFVPDRTPKDYVRPTGARHTFKVKNVPAKLNLRLLDLDFILPPMASFAASNLQARRGGRRCGGAVEVGAGLWATRR